MVSADAVQALLFRMGDRARDVSKSDTIEISLTFLRQLGLLEDEAREALIFLSTNPAFKCIDLKLFEEMQYADDGFETVDVIAHAKILANYDDTKHEFMDYYDYHRDKDRVVKARPYTDWETVLKRFSNSAKSLDWSSKTAEEVVLETATLVNPVRILKAQVQMTGNDIYLSLQDGRRALIKRLRTDQAPVYFMRYLMVHPNTTINKAVIQTEVEMCGQKQDMTELVRQCGFDKTLKPYFFSGTSKNQVHFSPDAEISDQIVAQT